MPAAIAFCDVLEGTAWRTTDESYQRARRYRPSCKLRLPVKIFQDIEIFRSTYHQLLRLGHQTGSHQVKILRQLGLAVDADCDIIPGGPEQPYQRFLDHVQFTV